MWLFLMGITHHTGIPNKLSALSYLALAPESVLILGLKMLDPRRKKDVGGGYTATGNLHSRENHILKMANCYFENREHFHVYPHR